MKSTIKKIALNRETLRNLNNQVLANAAGGASIPCYPPSYGTSCYEVCPVRQSDNCV